MMQATWNNEAMPEEELASLSNRYKALIDFKFLFLEQVLQLRTTWYFTLSLALLFPLLMLFGFARIGGLMTSKYSLTYIICGSATFSMVMEGIYTMSQRMQMLKEQGRFIYYASLPINKTALVLALLFSRLLIVGLPGMLVPLGVGVFSYGLELQLSYLWLLVLLPLTALSLATLGMLIGLVLPTAELVGMVANIGSFIMLMASSLFIPASALPLPLEILSYLLPPTYAADALRHLLFNTLDTQFYLDLTLLVLITLVSFVLINKFLRWRLD